MFAGISEKKERLISKSIKAIFFALWIVATGPATFAQADGKKNTVYVNLTNPLLFGGKNLILGYERVLTKNQSFTFNIGTFSLPGFGGDLNSDSVQHGSSSDKGFHISADYRFFLKKENKFEAPRGVYIGPYYSYNYFSRATQWQLNTSDFQGDVNTGFSLSYHTVGAELGYQFILWKRISLDFVMLGPGLAFYNLQTKLNTTLSEADQALLFDKLNSFLSGKIPGYSLVIDEGEFKKTGATRKTAAGFRYMINIGFRF